MGITTHNVVINTYIYVLNFHLRTRLNLQLEIMAVVQSINSNSSANGTTTPGVDSATKLNDSTADGGITMAEGTLIARQGGGSLRGPLQRGGNYNNVVPFSRNSNLTPLNTPLQALPSSTQKNVRIWNNSNPNSTLQTDGAIIRTVAPSGSWKAVGVDPQFNSLGYAESNLYNKAIYETRNESEIIMPGTRYTKGDFIRLMQARGNVETVTNPSAKNVAALGREKQIFDNALGSVEIHRALMTAEQR